MAWRVVAWAQTEQERRQQEKCNAYSEKSSGVATNKIKSAESTFGLFSVALFFTCKPILEPKEFHYK